MQINMQIALTQADIASAIRSYLRSEIPLRDDQDITVTLDVSEDGVFSATAITDKAEGVIVTETKTTRTRRSKAQIQADEEAAAAAASAGTETVENDAPAEDDKPPFEVDGGTEADDGDQTVNNATIQVGSITPAPGSIGLKIFPDTASSAPAMIQPEPTPVPIGAKSLFANLGNPSAAAH